MNPAQLLDPRGFAKQSAKKKKKVPNYGPRQSRKPSSTTDNKNDATIDAPTYDPKTLLDPKAASSGAVKGRPAMDSTSSTTATSANGEQDTANTTSLYERHHGVTNRQAPMPAKRKVPGEFDDDDDDNTKKQKATVGAVGRGGVLGEHLRKEREKLSADISAAIDLTDDKELKDDDIEILGSKNLLQEVCLGMITVNVNAHAVPHVSQAVASRLGKTHWPQTRVHLHRPDPTQRHIIEVQDSTRKAFGKIDYAPATSLSWLMDGTQHTKFRMKAFLKMREREPGEASGQPISRSLKMTLTIYALRNKADKIGKWLKTKSLDLVDPPLVDAGVELYNPHKKQPLPDYRPIKLINGTSNTRPYSSQNPNYVTRTAEEMRREASSMFDSLTKTEDLPEEEPDASRIKTALKPHQKQALHFLLEHEHNDYTSSDSPGFSLWKRQHDTPRSSWYNVITFEERQSRPEPTRGGILADMMGLGKSLSILSLIAATNIESKDFGRSTVPQDTRLLDGINSKATLIVCPKSVLASWEEQIQLHSQAGKLTYFIYHGPSRTRRVQDMANYHIVLTSYGTLSTDFNATILNKRTLMRINWFRVVLDEAHTIRNSSTTASKACCELTAERRWAVTGTPVQNRLEDLGALIKFLRVKPFDDSQQWAQYITAPFKVGNSTVLQHLRLLVDSITLRRVKDTISLPKRTERNVRLQFTDAEQTLYSAFATRSNLKLQSLTRETKGLRGKSMIHVLRSIGRLRMLCAHGREMLNEDDMDEVKGFDESYAIDLGDEPDLVTQPQFMSERQAYDVLQMQYDGNMANCAHCNLPLANLDIVSEPESDADADDSDSEITDGVKPRSKQAANKDLMGYLTPCLHLLHPKCRQEHEASNPITADNYHECPICDTYVANEYIPLTKPGFQAFIAAKQKQSRLVKRANINPDTYVPHTKVRALIDALLESAEQTKRLPEGEPPIRSVVFSEWTTYLDLIEYGLDTVDIPHIRLDGSMALKTRAEVLKRFREDNDVTVLLVSIRAGGQGLNLTAASKVYLMEPQFNPGVEQQAVDRVHRLGQEREVEITHFIMNGSVEDGLLKLQQKKTKLAELSMDRRKTHDEEAKRKIEELRDLFK